MVLRCLFISKSSTHQSLGFIVYDSLLDSDFDVKDKRDAWNIFPHHDFINMHSKNQALGRYKTDLLFKKQEEGKLKGELKDIVSRMKFDDNLVIAKFTFK